MVPAFKRTSKADDSGSSDIGDAESTYTSVSDPQAQATVDTTTSETQKPLSIVNVNNPQDQDESHDQEAQSNESSALIEKIENSPELSPEYYVTTPGVATRAEINLVVSHIIKDRKEVDSPELRDKIMVNAGALLQQGATSPQFEKNRESFIWNYRLTNRTLDNAIHKVSGLTARKLARGMREEIMALAIRMRIPGNLSKRYKIDNPLAGINELIWVSDFNTFSNNPAMPEKVKVWLANNLKQRFNQQ